MAQNGYPPHSTGTVDAGHTSTCHLSYSFMLTRLNIQRCQRALMPSAYVQSFPIGSTKHISTTDLVTSSSPDRQLHIPNTFSGQAHLGICGPQSSLRSPLFLVSHFRFSIVTNIANNIKTTSCQVLSYSESKKENRFSPLFCYVSASAPLILAYLLIDYLLH